MFLSILTFDFDLILGSFLTFSALTGYFWGWKGFQKCFGIYSCSWTTFILYVSVISDIWFWLILGSFTLSQPNYSYGCFVVGVVVVVGLWQLLSYYCIQSIIKCGTCSFTTINEVSGTTCGSLKKLLFFFLLPRTSSILNKNVDVLDQL